MWCIQIFLMALWLNEWTVYVLFVWSFTNEIQKSNSKHNNLGLFWGKPKKNSNLNLCKKKNLPSFVFTISLSLSLSLFFSLSLSLFFSLSLSIFLLPSLPVSIIPFTLSHSCSLPLNYLSIHLSSLSLSLSLCFTHSLSVSFLFKMDINIVRSPTK